MLLRFSQPFLVFILLILFAACSGGSGGNGSTPLFNTQLQQALDSAVSDGAPGAAVFVALPNM